MNKYDYKYLNPFKWFILENFPFIEADFDALTNWQLFCKLGKEMNKIIDNLNSLGIETENLSQAFIDLQNYVNDYFENLDIQEEINTKLDEMAGDGTLEQIINQEIFSELNEKINKTYYSNNSKECTSTRLFRKIFETGQNNVNATETEYFSTTQGFCMITDKICAISLIPLDRTNTRGKIQIINIETGEVLNELIGNFGHLNDLSYNPDDNILYAGGLGIYENNTLTQSNDILVINYANFSYERITLENWVAGISYDKITKKLYVTNHNNVFEIDKTNYSIIKTIPLGVYTDEGSVGQTVKVNNDIIYRVNAIPNTIKIFDMTGQVLNLISLKEYADNMYPIGEMESIDFIGNYIYFNGQTSGNFTNYNIVGIYKTSLDMNLAPINTKSMAYGSSGSIAVYVNNLQNTLNPDGVSSPFNCLLEAIQFLNSPEAQKFSNHRIILAVTDILYYGCEISDTKLTHLDVQDQKIGSTTFLGVPNLNLTKCNFEATIPNRAIIICSYSNISFYRPSVSDINNISNGNAFEIANGHVSLNNKQTADIIQDNLKIILPNTASYLQNRTYELSNIDKQAQQPTVNNMVICTTKLDTAGQTAQYSINSNITDILAQMLRYKYIYFLIDGVNKYEVVRLLTNSSNAYRINVHRSSNANDSNVLSFMQYFLTFTANEIQVTNAKIINLTGGTATIVTSGLNMNIRKIWLSDE